MVCSGKASLPMLVTLLGMVTEVKLVHPKNAFSPIFFTLSGITTLVNDEQPAKAPLPMLVTLLGIVKEVGEEQPCIRVLVAVSMIALQFSRLSYIGFPSSTTILVNEVQPANAASPMLVTFLGIKTFVNKEHLEKAKCPMLVTLLGMVIEVGEEQPFIRVLVAVSIIALQLSRLSYIGFPSSKTILVSEVQAANTPSAMLVTLLGIKTLVNEEQPKKAKLPILLTLSGIATFVNEEQSQYLQPIITQYFIDNKSEIWLLFLIAHSKR